MQFLITAMSWGKDLAEMTHPARAISTPREGVSTRQLVVSAAVIVAGFVLLQVPRPTGLVANYVHKEDGQIFLVDSLRDGWASIFAQYSGYLHVAPRLISTTCAQASPFWFPGCVGIGVDLFRALLAVFAVAALLPYVRNWPWALAAGALFVFVPVGQLEALGNITNLRWFAVAGAFVLLLGEFRKPGWAIGGSLLVALCALSDPLTMIAAPLAVIAFVRLRRWALAVPVAYTVALAVHIANLQPGARPPRLLMYLDAPVAAWSNLLVRGPLEAQFGETGAEAFLRFLGVWAAVAIAAAVLAYLAVAVFGVAGPGRGVAIALVLGGMAVLGATLTFSDLDAITLTEYWRVGAASRYAVAPAILIGMALLLAADRILAPRPGGGSRWLRVIAIGSVAALALGYAADFRGDAWNTHGPTWRTTIEQAIQTCGTSDSMVTVQFTPTDVPMNWQGQVPCSWVRRA